MFGFRNRRKDKCITDTNVSVLTLGEAVKRWKSDGQFLMTEVNGSDSYESNDNNINPADVTSRIDKIESVLAGLDFVKEIHAPKAEPQPEPTPAPAPAE